jgi:ATP-dependent DNA helicase RecG
VANHARRSQGKAVREAVVNAVAHRDYASNASVQIMLFADRLEVWNPGDLPAGLTPDKLRKPHASIPRNPLIAEPLFWVRYIEKLGTGTLDMISLCDEAGLPEPEFRQEGSQWTVTLWRDWLTDKTIDRLALNDRQRSIVPLLKSKLLITNSLYQTIGRTTRKTAARDLEDLVNKGILVLRGSRRGAHYILAQKVAKKSTLPPPGPSEGNETKMGHLRQDPKPEPKRTKAKSSGKGSHRPHHRRT